MKEDYNDKDQKIFISWTREEISHVIGNMNIIQGDQMEMKTHTPGKQRKSYHWKCESNHKYKTCYWKYVEAAENTLTKIQYKTHIHIYIIIQKHTHDSFQVKKSNHCS